MNYGTKTSEIDWTAVVARAAQYARMVQIWDIDDDGELSLVKECMLGEFVEAHKDRLTSEEIEFLCTMDQFGGLLCGSELDCPIAEVRAL